MESRRNMAASLSKYGPTHLRTTKGDKSSPGGWVVRRFRQIRVLPTQD